MSRLTRGLVRLGICLITLYYVSLFSAEHFDRVEKIDYSKFTAEIPYISIYFRVFDNQGNFIKNLRRDDIQLKINHELRNDYSLKRDFSSDEWLLVMTLVDVSGSMKGKPLKDEKKALKTFVQNMGIYDKVSLITFNQDPRLLTPFTRQKEEVIAKIDSMIAKGNTSLYDAIFLAVQQTDSVLAPRKAVVVMSDGKDTASKIKYEDMLTKVKEAKSPIFTIGLGKSNKDVLTRISDISGGKYFYSPSSEDLMDIYFKIGEDLKNVYVLYNLRLYDVEEQQLFRFEITNQRTGKTIFYDHVPLNKISGKGKKVIENRKPLNNKSKPLSTFKRLKQLAVGKNIYISIGLALFILLSIFIFWIFFQGRFLTLKLVITVLLVLLYFVLQFIGLYIL